MAVRYHVLVSDHLIDQMPMLPSGLRALEREPTDPERHPGAHWWLFEDDDAEPELEGKRVELWFEDRAGMVTLTRRTVI